MTFSRREFLKAGLAGSLAVGAGGLLSACGTGNTIKAFTTSTLGKPRYGGTLRAGLTGGSTADTLDPVSAITNVDFSRIDNLYEPLVGLTPAAQPVFVLADELTPNAKATEWTIRIKQGITFHNGKDVTPESYARMVAEVAHWVAAANGCGVRLALDEGEPPLENDPAIVQLARALLPAAALRVGPAWRSVHAASCPPR